MSAIQHSTPGEWMDGLRAAAWIAGVSYATVPLLWLTVHPFAAKWREMKTSPWRMIGPLWIAMFVTCLAATWRWHRIVMYARPWTAATALVCFAIGVLVYRRIGRFGLARFSGLAELRPREHGQLLVVSGMHAWVRHPIYAGHLAMLLGWTLVSGLAVLYVVTPLTLLTGAWMIRAEERELVARFGDQYRRYQQRVPVLLPMRGRQQA